MGLLERAIIFATEAHEDHRDAGLAPYILHPLRVMLDLRKRGHNNETLAAAVLHDVIEDTGTDIHEIYYTFGDRVGRLVLQLTRMPGELYDVYITRLASNPLAREIKKADLRDNADLERVTENYTLSRRYAKAYYRLKKMGA